MVELIRMFSNRLFDYAESFIPQGSTEAKFILRSNFITLFVYSLVPVFIPVFIYLDAAGQSFIAIAVAFTGWLVMFLNKRFATAYGRVFQLLIFGAWLFYFSWIFGEDSAAHFLYLAYAVIPLITFPINKYPIHIAAFLIYTGLFWLIESDYTDFPGTLDLENQVMLKTIVFNLLFLWVFANFWLYNRSNVVFERAMLAAIDRAEEKNREMEHFVHIASHDLQEPLKTIHSFVTLSIEERDKTPEEEQMYLEQIGHAGERMQGLIKALMNHSRLGQSQRNRTDLNLNIIVDRIQTEVQDSFQEHRIRFEVMPLPTINANEEDIVVLFEQLIYNAIKFSHPGQEALVNIRNSSQGRFYRFEIEDSGIGISGPNANKIFDIFQKLHHSDDYPGMGVGLAYARKIVRSYEGEIGFSNKPEGGTIFYFTLARMEA